MDVEGMDSYLAYYNHGTLNISDSTVDVDDDIIDYNYGDVDISGSAIVTGYDIVYYNYGGDVTISDTDIDADDYVVDDNYGGDVTITGGTIECSTVVDDNYGTLTLDGAEVSCSYAVICCNYGDLVVKSTSGAGIVSEYLVSSSYEGTSVTIESGDFTCDDYVVSSLYGDLVIKDGTFTCLDDGIVSTVEEGASVTIEDGTFDIREGFCSNYGDVTINGGTFVCSDYLFDDSYEGSTVTINGGTYDCEYEWLDDIYGTVYISNATVTVDDPDAQFIDLSDPGKASFANGTVTCDVDYDGEGHKKLTAVEDSSASNTTFLLNGHLGLMECAKDGDLVKLTSDTEYESDDEIEISSDITFDCDGHKLTVTGGDLFDVTEDGTLTLVNGNIDAEGDIVDDNYGKVIVEGGTFSCYDFIDETYEGGSVIIKGGTYDCESYCFDDIYGTADIYDATVTSDSACIYVCDTGVVNVYGGTFTTMYDAISVGGKITLRGGTFTATDDTGDGCIYIWADSDDQVIIPDGYYADPADWKESNASKVVVKPLVITVNFYTDDTLYDTEEGKIGEFTMPDDPTKAGCDFLYWENDLGCRVDTLDGIVKDTNLYAVFSNEQCTVTFDDNGTKTTETVSVGDILNKIYQDGKLQQLSRATESKDGGFYGWMLDGAKVDETSNRIVGESITLVAKYITSLAQVSTYDELVDAIAGTADYIELLAPIDVTGTVQIGRDCTLFSKDGTRIGLIRPAGFTGVLLEIINPASTSSDSFDGVDVTGTNVTLDNILVSGENLTADKTAVVVNPGTTLNLNQSTVQNNVNSTWYGGGIYVEDATLNLTDCTIKGNESNYQGGGIYAEDSDVAIVGSRILNNTTGYYGGGMYVDNSDSGSLSIDESTIDGNTANYGGGAYLTEWGKNRGCAVDITDSQITNNKAQDGGGLNYEGAIVNLNGNTHVSGNTAEGYGGGVYSQDGNKDDCHIILNDDSEISYNTAGKSGGGVCCDELYLEMRDNSSIHDNTAGENGGGVYAAGYGMSQLAGTIYNNHADGEGGGVYVSVYDERYGDKGFDAGMIYDNTAADAGDDIQFASRDASPVYSTQPDRKLGDGKSADLDTVAVKQIDGYHKATAEDGISVPWDGWFLDGTPEYGTETINGWTHTIVTGYTDRYTDRDGETMPVDGEHTMVDADTYPALKAIWTGLVLAYDANFGDDPAYQFDSQAYKQSQTASVMDYSDLSKLPERAGYVFLGWNTKADGTGTAYSADDAFTVDDSSVLYAMWGCAVDYDVAGDDTYGTPDGAVVPTDENKYEIGDSVKVADPLATGQATAQHPDGRAIPGTWKFVGTRADGTSVPDGWDCSDWADGDIASIDRSTVIAGHWEFAPDTYKVAYEVLADAVYGTPDDSVVPADPNAYIFDDVVKVAADLVSVQGWAMLDGQKVLGEWIFSAWDKAGSFLIDGDTLISGSWTFVPSPEPEPEPESSPDPEPTPDSTPSGEQAACAVQDAADAASPKTADSQTAIPAAAAIALGACAMALEALRRRKKSM